MNSFFDFRSSFPVFPTSLKLRAKKILWNFSIFYGEDQNLLDSQINFLEISQRKFSNSSENGFAKVRKKFKKFKKLGKNKVRRNPF